jgi:hypothetical protein
MHFANDCAGMGFLLLLPKKALFFITMPSNG